MVDLRVQTRKHPSTYILIIMIDYIINLDDSFILNSLLSSVISSGHQIHFHYLVWDIP